MLFLQSKHPVLLTFASKHASELSRDPTQNKKLITLTCNKENNQPDMKEIQCKGRQGMLNLHLRYMYTCVHKSKVDLKFTCVGFKINIVLAV